MNQQIGRYTIIEEIGHGGFAAVFRAIDTTLEREVAIKVMRPLLMSDPEFVARFQREAKVAASLQHPNIIPIYDYGEYEGRLFLVMKLMQDSLAKRLEQGPLPWEQVVALGQQIAAGLDFAHRRGAIHRDIKPDNILLDEQGNALLADFGVVKAMAQSTLTVSMSGGILGTPAYIAPEVWSDQPATPVTDVYALACMVYEMVMGQKLFNASTPPATMTLHFQPLQLPDRWPDGTPPGLSDVLRRALAQDPVQRTQTAVELTASLTTLTLDSLADRYTALQAALDAGNWLDAIALAEAILAQNPTYKDTSALLQQATTGQMAAQQTIQAAQWQEQAEQAVAAGNWVMAFTAIQRWQQITPNNPAAQQLLVQVQASQNLVATPSTPNPQLKPASKPESIAPPKEKSTIPGWVWFVAGAIIIGLLFFGGSQLIGNFDKPYTVIQTATSPVVAIANIETPTIRPESFQKATDEPTIMRTNTPSPTAQPTNTRRPTSVPSPTSRPSPQGSITWAQGSSIYKMDPNGGNLVHITEGLSLYDLCTNTDMGNLDVSPNRDFLGFSFYCARDGKYGYDIYRMDYNVPASLNRLTTNGVSYAVSWAPNNLYMVYVKGLGPDEGLYIMNANGSNKTIVVPGSNIYISNDAWSPDSSEIIYRTNDGTYTVNINNGYQNKILNFPLGNPAWSPDGEYVAGVTNEGIVIMEMNDNNITFLTTGDNPAWSPDGQHLVFTLGWSDNAEIYIISRDGTDKTRLTNNSVQDSSPVWTQ